MIFLCWAPWALLPKGAEGHAVSIPTLLLQYFLELFDFTPTNDSAIRKLEVLGAVEVHYLRFSLFFLFSPPYYDTVINYWNSLEETYKAQSNHEAYTTWAFLFFSFFFCLAGRLYTHFWQLLAESTCFTCWIIIIFFTFTRGKISLDADWSKRGKQRLWAVLRTC